jgi:hypothetical protein
MAITVTKANFTRTLYWSILLLGMQDPDFTAPTVKEDAPFTLDNFKEAVMQADIEQALVIVDLLDHPYRNAFFTETPASLAYGDRIPVAIGPHSKVAVTYTEGGGGHTKTVFGRLARNRQHIELCNDQSDIFGDGHGLYWMQDGHIFFCGDSAAVHSPTVNLNRSTVISSDTLLNPDAYANGVIARSFKMLYMNGQDQSHRKFYIDQADRFDRRIAGMALDLPEPEVFQQLNN